VSPASAPPPPQALSALSALSALTLIMHAASLHIVEPCLVGLKSFSILCWALWEKAKTAPIPALRLPRKSQRETQSSMRAPK
jgi:hypothetical protein